MGEDLVNGFIDLLDELPNILNQAKKIQKLIIDIDLAARQHQSNVEAHLRKSKESVIAPNNDIKTKPDVAGERPSVSRRGSSTEGSIIDMEVSSKGDYRQIQKKLSKK